MCIYQKIRSKKYIKYIYCTKNKKEITYETCNNCKNKEYKKVKPIKASKTKIKTKSNKLLKLERQRDKGLIKSGICECCRKYSKRLDPHEIYGGSNRKRSIEHKFIKLICPECHSNENKIMQLRIDTEKKYEENYSREEFIKIIGKSYL